MSRAVGAKAEDVVLEYLKSQGFVVVDRNVNYGFGELDLVANDGTTLVFVEVKYRKRMDFGLPYEAVTRAKQKKIIRAASAYLQRFDSEPECRFDVISLCGDLSRPELQHIRDAFLVEED